jgi:DNA-binding response OmpR family regulator
MSESRARLLFVDDEPSIRMTLPPVLRKAGFEVSIAENVSDALFEINSGQFDVLISDLNIGEEGDGFLITSAMRHVQPQCLTFILTGYPAFETALQAIHNHIDDYLVKPVDIDVLTKVLKEKLQNRGPRFPFAPKRLAAVLKTDATQIVSRVTAATSRNGNSAASGQYLSRLLNAFIEQLESGRSAPSADLLRIAHEYGKKLAEGNHGPTELAAQFRCLEQEAYAVVQKNMNGMDMPTLISDLKIFSASLHSLLEESLNGYARRFNLSDSGLGSRSVRPKRRAAG